MQCYLTVLHWATRYRLRQRFPRRNTAIENVTTNCVCPFPYLSSIKQIQHFASLERKEEDIILNELAIIHATIIIIFSSLRVAKEFCPSIALKLEHITPDSRSFQWLPVETRVWMRSYIYLHSQPMTT